MPLTLDPIMRDAGLDPADVIVIRHAFANYADGHGLHADSTDEQILEYTAEQMSNGMSFPATPPRFWIVCIREGGSDARLWSVLENHGEIRNDGTRRYFNLVHTDYMQELCGRLIIGWSSPRRWCLYGTAAGKSPVISISDRQNVPFPGFDSLLLDYTSLQAVIREKRYASWRETLASVKGIYLITDTRTGESYVRKADGENRILQRWTTYAVNGHGGNLGLIGRDLAWV